MNECIYQSIWMEERKKLSVCLSVCLLYETARNNNQYAFRFAPSRWTDLIDSANTCKYLGTMKEVLLNYHS